MANLEWNRRGVEEMLVGARWHRTPGNDMQKGVR